MCQGAAPQKTFLGILSVVFWGVAAGLMFMGAWMYKEYQHYDQIADAKYTLIPATIIMASGVFLFLLGIIGCVGAFKEQKCLLALFFSVMLLIFVGLVAGSALAYVYRDMVHDHVRDGIQDGLDHYGNNSALTTEVDFMQKELKCCGLNNYTDWESTPWYAGHAHENKTHLYPESCCKEGKCDYSVTVNNTRLYEKGCDDKLREQFLNHLGIIAGVGAAFAVVQILGMVCSCVLICRRKSDVPYIGLNEPTGMRV